jgi:HEPN domain-containing protein
MLKAVIVHRKGGFPPRIHQLMRLAQIAELSLSNPQADFLRELSSYYIQTRYPEEIRDMAEAVDPVKSQSILDQTQEMKQWLASIL